MNSYGTFYLHCNILEWEYSYPHSSSPHIRLWAEESITSMLGEYNISISLSGDNDDYKVGEICGSLEMVRGLHDYDIEDLVEAHTSISEQYLNILRDNLIATSNNERLHIMVTLKIPISKLEKTQIIDGGLLFLSDGSEYFPFEGKKMEIQDFSYKIVYQQKPQG